MKLKNNEITATSVEISKSLINKGPGYYRTDLYLTEKIGNTARLAANIRQKEIINYDQLTAMSVVLKQDPVKTIDSYLHLLKEIGWVDIEGSRTEMIINENIPNLSKCLSKLGDYFLDNNPDDIEIGMHESLLLSKDNILNEEDLLIKLSVDGDKAERSLDYNRQLNLLGSFKTENIETVVWTPFYWPQNTDKVLKYLKKQNYSEFDELINFTNEISSFQGKPLRFFENKKLVMEGIKYGFFPSTGVVDEENHMHQYVFKSVPDLGLSPKNDIFEKARQIVSCIRYGQHDVKNYRKILYPVALLNALKENGFLHPHANIQYFQLLISGVCDCEKVGDSYKIKYVPSPENDIAMKIAKEMLKGDSEPKASIYEEKILGEGVYFSTSELRNEYNEIPDNDPGISSKIEFNRLMDVLFDM